MRLVDDDPDLDLMILLADMHGSAQFGNTAEEVYADFPNARIELIEMGTGESDTALARTRNLARCLAGATEILDAWRPDLVFVHGDRGEHLVVAFAAVNLGVAVAHTQGGDRSGNIDEVQRHAITKLSHVHFPESAAAGERLRMLGEDPWRIHVVGSTYVDRIVQGLYVEPASARQELGLAADEPFVLAVVHPETFLDSSANEAMAESVFEALGESGVRAVVTYPCSDPGYEGILASLRRREADPAFLIRPNIENDVYLGLMAEAEALVGNSSAALVEAPYFRLPAVNVGRRQEGRDRDANVIDSVPDKRDVAQAIARARTAAFRASLPLGTRLGDGHAAERIVETVRSLRIDDALLRKQIAY